VLSCQVTVQTGQRPQKSGSGCYTNNDASPWVQIPGALTDIGAGVDGTVWGVNSAGNIYRYTGDLPG
jgi:hypothetical protein